MFPAVQWQSFSGTREGSPLLVTCQLQPLWSGELGQFEPPCREDRNTPSHTSALMIWLLHRRGAQRHLNNPVIPSFFLWGKKKKKECNYLSVGKGSSLGLPPEQEKCETLRESRFLPLNILAMDVLLLKEMQ